VLATADGAGAALWALGREATDRAGRAAADLPPGDDDGKGTSVGKSAREVDAPITVGDEVPAEHPAVQPNTSASSTAA
jgi:hypothetical protein